MTRHAEPIPDVEGLVERLERRETSASKYGGYALVNPDGPEAATALLTLSSEIERLREAGKALLGTLYDGFATDAKKGAAIATFVQQVRKGIRQ